MPGRARTIAGLALLLAVALASLADAELSARGDLFVKFSGGIEPTALPRRSLAPISVEVGGTVKTLSGAEPPALRRIVIALNRSGRLQTRGLPTCRREQLEASTSRTARQLCGGALVGEGTYVGDTTLPEQADFPSRGRILAFNARLNGKSAILAHVYGPEPVPTSRVIVFHLRHVAGTFGTVLVGQLPASVNRHGYLRRIRLRLHRTYAYRGRRLSYLSAACEAPAGFSAATFPFARTSMSFADGRTLGATLVRSCQVRSGS